MTRSAVAARYANALADVVTGPKSSLRPQDAVAELWSFEAALRSSPELNTALQTPALPGGRKKAVIGRIADLLNLSRVSRNFLNVLIDHRRMAELSDIIHGFELILDERLGFARVEVTSAADLTEPQRAGLNTEMQRLTGKRVRMHFSVDHALIGGVVARVGSTVYDGSVRGQLEAIGRRLNAED